MHRFLTDTRPLSAHLPTTPIEFYKEELTKHRLCLELQREYYSERAINGVETALEKLTAQLEQLCRQQDADRIISRLLRKFDVLTGLSAWSDPKKVN